MVQLLLFLFRGVNCLLLVLSVELNIYPQLGFRNMSSNVKLYPFHVSIVN